MGSSSGGRAIDIAGCVEDQASLWGPSIVAVEVEVVQHFFRPTAARFRHQLEDRTGAVCAAAPRCAVEIAGRIEDQAAVGIGVSLEAVQYLFLGNRRVARGKQEQRKGRE